MQRLLINFTHELRDIIPYCEFIAAIRPVLAERNLGSYIGDDMAIDGADAEAEFEAVDADALLRFLVPYLVGLRFMRDATLHVMRELDDPRVPSTSYTLNEEGLHPPTP